MLNPDFKTIFAFKIGKLYFLDNIYAKYLYLHKYKYNFLLNFNFLHIFFVKFIRTVLMDPFKLFIEIGLDEIQFKKI